MSWKKGDDTQISVQAYLTLKQRSECIISRSLNYLSLPGRALWNVYILYKKDCMWIDAYKQDLDVQKSWFMNISL